MTYYIVMNEWNYPTESGREFVGDFDSIDDARCAAKSLCDKQEEIFLKVVGEIDSVHSGYRIYKFLHESGRYIITHEDSPYFFRSVIIEREV